MEHLTTAFRATPVLGELSSAELHQTSHEINAKGANQEGSSPSSRNGHDIASTPPCHTPTIKASKINTPPMTPSSQVLKSRILSASNTPSTRRRRYDLLELDRESDGMTGSPKRRRITTYEDDEEVKFVRETSITKSKSTTHTSVRIKSTIVRKTVDKDAAGGSKDTAIVLE